MFKIGMAQHQFLGLQIMALIRQPGCHRAPTVQKLHANYKKPYPQSAWLVPERTQCPMARRFHQ